MSTIVNFMSTNSMIPLAFLVVKFRALFCSFLLNFEVLFCGAQVNPKDLISSKVTSGISNFGLSTEADARKIGGSRL